MELISVEDDEDKGLTYRKESKSGLIEIGVFRVMFGWRVRAGFVNSFGGCELDWCAGGNWNDVERLYSLCLAILSKRDENHECFKGIPLYSQIKPFYMDRSFLEIVSKEAGDFELLKLSGYF